MEQEGKTPKVSIYIPTKNRKDLLIRAVKSCLNQTYKNLEIIVIDDGSTDNTQSEVEKLASVHKNLIYLRNEKSMGSCFSRNFGIREANGNYVTGLDDDDYFLPNRIEEFVINYRNDYAFLCSNAKQLGFKDKLSYFFSGQGKISLDQLLFANVVGNQIFVAKERILKVGGYDEQLTACQDYDMWIRLVKEYGDAYKLKTRTIVFDEYASGSRISHSTKAFRGYLTCFNKYRRLMNNKQRANWLSTIRRVQGKKMDWHYFNLFRKYLGFFIAAKRYLGNILAN